MRIVMPKCLDFILRRQYDQDSSVPKTVRDFFVRILKIFLSEAERETYECAEMLQSLLSKHVPLFRLVLDQSGDSDGDPPESSKWSTALKVGDMVDYFDTQAQQWVPAWVTMVTPELVEVHFDNGGGKTMYHEMQGLHLDRLVAQCGSFASPRTLQVPRLRYPWPDAAVSDLFGDVLKAATHLGVFECMITRVQDSEKVIPAHILALYSMIISHVSGVLDAEVRQQIVPRFQQSTFECLEKMEPKHFKSFSRESLTDIMHSCGTMLLPMMSYDEMCAVVEPFWLKVCLKCFSHPSLEKRILAIDLVNELIFLCNNRQQYPDGFKTVSRCSHGNNMDVTEPVMMMRQLTCDDVAEVFERHQLLQSLFSGPGAHVSLMERADSIIRFLESMGSFGDKGVAMLWSHAIGMHESHLRSICGLLGRIACHLKHPTLDHLCILIIDAPSRPQLTLVVIKLMGELAAAQEARPTSIDESKSSTMNIDDNPKASSLHFLWDLSVEEKQAIAEPVAQQAMVELEFVLGLDDCSHHRAEWANRCVEKIKLGSSAAASKCLYLLRQILLAYPFKAESGMNTRQMMISSLDQHGDLLALVLDSLKQCRAEMATEIQDVAEVPESVGKLKQMVDSHLEFLKFVIVNSQGAIQLGLGHVDTLWDTLVLRGTPAELDWVCEWLQTLDKKQHEGWQVHDTALAEHVFDKYLSTLQPQRVTLHVYLCVQAFFLSANALRDGGLLTRSEAQYWRFEIETLELHGLQYIWCLAEEAEDPHVLHYAISFLSRLPTQISALVHKDRYEAILLSYVEHCMAASKQSKKRLPSLKLLWALIDNVEGSTRDALPVPHQAMANGDPMLIRLQYAGADDRQGPQHDDISVHSKQTILDLMRRSAHLLNLEVAAVRLFLASGRELCNGAHTLTEAGISVHSVVWIIPRLPVTGKPQAGMQPMALASENHDENRHFPSLLISFHYFDELLELCQHDECDEDVWKLLMRIPSNSKMRQMFRELLACSDANLDAPTSQVPPIAEWQSQLQVEDIFRLSYSLELIESLLWPSEASSVADGVPHVQLDEMWVMSFLDKGGFAALLGLLMQEDMVHRRHTCASDENRPGAFRNTIFKGCQYLAIKLACNILDYMQRWRQEDPTKGAIANKVLETVDYSALKQQAARISAAAASESLPQDTLVVAWGLQLMNHCLTYTSMALDSVDCAQQLTHAALDAQESSVRHCAEQFFLAAAEKQPPTHAFLVKELAGALFEPTQEVGHTRGVTKFVLLARLYAAECRSATAEIAVRLGEVAVQAGLRIQESSLSEESANLPPDGVMLGLLKVVHSVLEHLKDDELRKQCKERVGPGLISQIWHTYLFSSPSLTESGTTEMATPKCKTKQTRQAAFELLGELCRESSSNMAQLLELLMTQVTALGPTPYSKWQCAPLEAGKASNGYVGLRNLGNTCYMNATLQQLYNMPKLRYGILSVPRDFTGEDSTSATPATQSDKEGEEKSNVLDELWKTFSWLDISDRQAYDPYGFCGAYKHHGEAVDVLVQMDASEFFTSLCEQIEEELKPTPQKQLLAGLFGGQVCQQLVCLGECGRIKSSLEPHYVLQLDVKNHRSLHDACEAYVQGELLEDFKCEECNKQVKTRKRAALASMGSTLIINLKRFEFDYDTFTRRKLNDYFEFPEHFDAWPYSVEGVKHADAQSSQDGTKSVDRQYVDHPKEYYEYVLRGVVVHMGSAETGHYYSFIREREPRSEGETCRWLRFDDATVTEFDMENRLEEECFGGECTEKVFDKMTGNMQGRTVMRTRNAYMLVYERQNAVPVQNENGQEVTLIGSPGKYLSGMVQSLPDTLTSHLGGHFGGDRLSSVVARLNHLIRSTVSTEPTDSSAADSHLFHHVLEDNRTFLRDQQIVDSAYMNFVAAMLEALPEEQCICDDWDTPNPPGLLALKAITAFTLEVTAHARDSSSLSGVTANLKRLLCICIPACRWFLEQITAQGRWLHKLLFECPQEKTRELFVDLLGSVLTVVAKCEENAAQEPATTMGEEGDDEVSKDSACLLLTFRVAHRVLGLIEEARQSWRKAPQFFQLLLAIANLGTKHTVFLLDNKVVQRMTSFLLGEEAERDPSRQRFPRGSFDKSTSPDLANFFVCLRYLVKHTKPHVSLPAPPSIEQDFREMDPGDYHHLCSQEFLECCLRQCHQDPVALSDVLIHLYHGHSGMPDTICGVMMPMLMGQQLAQDHIHAVFCVMQRLMSMEDEFMMQRNLRFLNDSKGILGVWHKRIQREGLEDCEPNTMTIAECVMNMARQQRCGLFSFC